MRTLRNLNALRAFEAAARHFSYVAAGNELCVTPAAVGQLVRSLEDSLGVGLFHRSRSGPSRLVLTEAARSAIPELTAGFELLASAVERLRSRDAREVIVISAPRAFADTWLLPRINRLRDRHPGCDVVIATSHDVAERLAGRGCVAVRYGHGRWPGWDATLLFKDTIFPVCHPDRVAGGPPPLRAEDLRTVPLIHDASAGSEGGLPPWRTWLRLAGVDGVDDETGLCIDDPGSVIAAAVAGAGVALGRSALVARDLADGRLMCPFGPSLEGTAGYYAVHRPEHAGRAGIAMVRDWLLGEAAQTVGTGVFLPTTTRSSPLWPGAEERETAQAAFRPAASVAQASRPMARGHDDLDRPHVPPPVLRHRPENTTCSRTPAPR